MKAPANRIVMAMALLTGLAGPACSKGEPAGRKGGAVMAEPPSRVEVQQQGAGRWAVRAVRERGGRSAEGVAVVLQEGAPDQQAPPHLLLASGRAWLALGRSLGAAGDWQASVACARAAIKELGYAYAAPRAVDDTDWMVIAAEEHLKEGRIEEGGKGLLAALETRLRLYVMGHRASIAP
jgi:hypothetical protein